MNLIDRITNNPYQRMTLVLDDGTAFVMTLYYRPLQTGWFIENLTYGEFVLNGMRLCNSPNMLYQWQKKIPFGLGCFSSANREPMLIDDFSSGASKLYILNEAEVAEYTAYITEG